VGDLETKQNRTGYTPGRPGRPRIWHRQEASRKNKGTALAHRQTPS